jgi:hypothetical protein
VHSNEPYLKTAPDEIWKIPEDDHIVKVHDHCRAVLDVQSPWFTCERVKRTCTKERNSSPIPRCHKFGYAERQLD